MVPCQIKVGLLGANKWPTCWAQDDDQCLAHSDRGTVIQLAMSEQSHSVPTMGIYELLLLGPSPLSYILTTSGCNTSIML